MVKKTTVHCDQCGQRVDYTDADSDCYEEGFYPTEGKPYKEVKFSNHFKTSCGSSSHPIKPLVIPDNICSKRCMIDYFHIWATSLPDSRKVSDG